MIKKVICINLDNVYEELYFYWNDFNLKISFLVIVSKYGFLIIVFDLIKFGVNINYSDGLNILLIVVCKNGYFGIVIELINVKVEINMGINFYILLVVVSENGYIDIVKELIKVGVDVNIYENNVLIMFVSKNGCLFIV